jgi:alpha-tubulin suppressor-like RCC1 family protein
VCAAGERHRASWGNNFYGELGDDSSSNSLTPVDVSGLTNAVTIMSSEADSCASTATGTAECWGDNSTGQLGNGTTNNSGTPVLVTGL